MSEALRDRLALGSLLVAPALLLSGCSNDTVRPLPSITSALERSSDARRDPSMAQGWLATVSSRDGRERVELVDLRNGTPIPTPGLNWADAQPVSISLSGDGQRLALVQQRDGRTELMLYRRDAAALQRFRGRAGAGHADDLDALVGGSIAGFPVHVSHSCSVSVLVGRETLSNAPHASQATPSYGPAGRGPGG